MTKPTILLVEDEALIALNEQMTLENAGYKVVLAGSGEKAIEIVWSNPDIDLILMDIDLGSEMDGTEAAEIILRDHDLPVVFLSSHTELEIVEKTEKITSYGYIAKNSGDTVLLTSIKMASKLFEAKRKKEKTEKALRESENKYSTVVQNATVAICVVQDDRFRFLNPEATRLFDYSVEELIRLDPNLTIHPDEREWVSSTRRKRIQGEAITPIYSHRIITRDKRIRWVEIRTVNIEWNERPAVMVFLTDITERKQAEEKIQASLREKETLLREIHHRVKNNMNVVSSLLSLHKHSTRNEEVKKELEISQSRVFAMAAVHETLYDSENLSEIDLKAYLTRLTESLIQAYSINPDKRQVLIEGDDVKLGIEKAFPVGLTVNEMLSNSLKYAFPDDRNGEIRIKLALSGTWLEIIVQDNGIGMPDGLDWRKTNSLGLRLIRSLIENQLGGSIEMDNTNGTRFTLHFNTEES